MNQKTWYMTSRTLDRLDSEGRRKTEALPAMGMGDSTRMEIFWTQTAMEGHPNFKRLESKDADGFWGEALDGDW